VAALSEHLGIPVGIFQEACREFAGVCRRQEIRGEEGGVIVIDDFAHHPTAVEETVRAVKEKYPGGRVMAVFEPRSNSSRRNIFQNRYAGAFDHADMVFIAEPPMMEKIPPEDRFSSEALVKELEERGRKAFYGENTESLLDKITRQARSRDVVLVMSNGAFDNIHERLLKRLAP
jgi:UDP-N-acetylmuramate: L-alanyl-gamma-D-glutamyl-meso-diaminopimelate ligase